MFEELINILESLEETSIAHANTLKGAFERVLPSVEGAIQDELVAKVDLVTKDMPEYGAPEAQPLREHLLENLTTGHHVKISAEGHVLSVLDEEYAGTAEDFDAAKWPSKNNDAIRYVLWKYGIYQPSVEGNSEIDKPWLQRAIQKLPDYEEVIQYRLGVWGPKAPYWWFIEHGTQSGGARGYPSFPGTAVFSNFEVESQEMMRDFFNAFANAWEDLISKDINKTIETGKTTQPPTDDIVWLESDKNPNWRRRYSRSARRFLRGR
jgi:hypothetical protein